MEIKFDIINLPYEEIGDVIDSRIELKEDSLMHLLDYYSKTKSRNEDGTFGEWGENLRNYKKTTIRKDSINSVELVATEPIDEHERCWALSIEGDAYTILTFFDLMDLSKAKSVESDILKWLNW